MDWMTAREAAQYAHVSTKTLYAAVKAKKLKAAPIGAGRNLRFCAHWVDLWLMGSSLPEDRVSSVTERTRET